jgi:RHS repeat-associated protein
MTGKFRNLTAVFIITGLAAAYLWFTPPAHALHFDIALLNGDTDSDNEVTTADLSIMIMEMGWTSAHQDWNSNHDLDGDLEITMTDLSIVITNLRAIGADELAGDVENAPTSGYALTGHVVLGDWPEEVTDPPYDYVQPILVKACLQNDPNATVYKKVVDSHEEFTMYLPEQGVYIITAEVADTASSYARHWLRQAISGVDVVMPIPGTATSPGYCTSSTVTVSYTGASDAGGSGLKQVELWYKKGLHGEWTDSTLTSTTASGSFSFSFPSGEGTYYFDLVAEDNVGNRSSAASDNGDCATIYETDLDASGRAFIHSEYLYPGGPLVRVTAHDENGDQVRETTHAYGPEGEVDSRTGSTESISYTYDALYRIKTISDGKSNTTAYTYDDVGNLTCVDLPGGESIQYPAHDANGNVLQSIDAKGIVTNYLYDDPENLLTDIQYPATPGLDVHYTYDAAYGRCMGVTDGEGALAYAYDDLDLVTGVTATYTGLPACAITYDFYPNGSLETMTTPAGSFTYTYDAAGRPTGLANPFGETYSWSYLNNNWLATQTSNNWQSTTVAVASYAYNQRGFLTDLANRDGSSNLLSQYGGATPMAYDSIGNLLIMPTSVPGVPAYGGTTTYGYDLRDQLLLETSARNGGYSHAFAYDDAGNPTTFEGVTRTFNAKNQNTAFTFDANGNPTAYNGAALIYDPEDRMTAYGTALTAGYTANGLRAWKNAESGRTYFLYSVDTPVCEMDAQGNITAVNTFGANGLLSRRTVSTGATDFYTFDPQGSVAQVQDSSSTVTATLLYDAYGTRLSTSRSVPYGYGAQSGYYTDAETGLQLLTHRYYDPEEGRFLTRDPIGYSGGMNLYAYVDNDPANANDPAGLYPGEKFRNKFKQWSDGLAAAAIKTGKGRKEQINNKLASGPLGILGATAANSLIDVGTGLLGLPSTLAHFGEGAGTFFGDPSLENSALLGQDMITAASLGLAAAGALDAAAGRAAASSEIGIAPETGYIPTPADLAMKAAKDFARTNKALKQEQAEAFVEYAKQAGVREARIDMGHVRGKYWVDKPHVNIGQYHIPIK